MAVEELEHVVLPFDQKFERATMVGQVTEPACSVHGWCTAGLICLLSHGFALKSGSWLYTVVRRALLWERGENVFVYSTALACNTLVSSSVYATGTTSRRCWSHSYWTHRTEGQQQAEL